MPAIGFAVLYRWRLHPGREDDFVAAWAEMTAAIRRERGGLGSRLLRSDDGTWVAYAQWPDRAAWEAAQAGESVAPAAAAVMGAAIAERFPAIPLEPLAGLLSTGGGDD